MLNHNKTKPRVTDVDLIIAKNLLKHRKLARIPLRELAENLNISIQQLAKYEKGQNRISASRLYSFAKLFKTSTDSLFDQHDTEPNINAIEHKKLLRLFSQINDPQKRELLFKIMQLFKD